MVEAWFPCRQPSVQAPQPPQLIENAWVADPNPQQARHTIAITQRQILQPCTWAYIWWFTRWDLTLMLPILGVAQGVVLLPWWQFVIDGPYIMVDSLAHLPAQSCCHFTFYYDEGCLVAWAKALRDKAADMLGRGCLEGCLAKELPVKLALDVLDRLEGGGQKWLTIQENGRISIFLWADRDAIHEALRADFTIFFWMAACLVPSKAYLQLCFLS